MGSITLQILLLVGISCILGVSIGWALFYRDSGQVRPKNEKLFVPTEQFKALRDAFQKLEQDSQKAERSWQHNEAALLAQLKESQADNDRLKTRLAKAEEAPLLATVLPDEGQSQDMLRLQKENAELREALEAMFDMPSESAPPSQEHFQEIASLKNQLDASERALQEQDAAIDKLTEKLLQAQKQLEQQQPQEAPLLSAGSSLAANISLTGRPLTAPKPRPRRHTGRHQIQSLQQSSDKVSVVKVPFSLEGLVQEAEKSLSLPDTGKSSISPSSADEKHDNLLEIHGIRPQFLETFEAMGLTSWQQVAELRDDQLTELAQQLNIPKEKIKREQWVEQAQSLIQ